MRSRILIVLAVLTAANIYVALSLYIATSSNLVWWIAALLLLLEFSMPVLRFKGEGWAKKNPSVAPLISGAGLLSMLAIAVFSMVFAFTAVRDIALFIARFIISSVNLEMASSASVKFELGLTAVLLLVGIYQALRGPGIKTVEVPLKGLPKAFAGFRIVQISDLHIGYTIGTAYVKNVVNAVNALKPDMIAMTGDITDGDPSHLGGIAKELSGMNSTFGRFFVTGNHEYYHNAPQWIELHQENGTRVLTNQNHVIEKEGQKLAILGVPDVTSHHFVPTHRSNPEAAAAGVPKDVIKILLAHQPVSYKAGHKAGVNLQLSGHTHSGQFFPWNLVIGFFHDYYRGLGRFKDMWIYVNPGTGYWGPPLRTAVSSEITLLVLTES